MSYLCKPRAALALLATAVVCTTAQAGESEPRRINAWVSVVAEPATGGQPAPVVFFTDGVLPEWVSADPDGGWRADLSGRFPLGMGGFVDADGRLHSECSARTVGQRLLDRHVPAHAAVEQ